MRLLLIEDDPTVTKGIELMLTSEDIEVQTTELGQDGLDLGSVFLYDLILLDLNLPDMSGYEVLRSLRLGNIKTPVLILSGLDGTEHKVKGLGPESSWNRQSRGSGALAALGGDELRQQRSTAVASMRRAIRDPNRLAYMDPALAPVSDDVYGTRPALFPCTVGAL